jgi:hypothetical protein
MASTSVLQPISMSVLAILYVIVGNNTPCCYLFGAAERETYILHQRSTQHAVVGCGGVNMLKPPAEECAGGERMEEDERVNGCEVWCCAAAEEECFRAAESNSDQRPDKMLYSAPGFNRRCMYHMPDVSWLPHPSRSCVSTNLTLKKISTNKRASKEQPGGATLRKRNKDDTKYKADCVA